MSNVDFDYEALREGFRHVVHADNEHQHAHAADRPFYPSQAAGQGFSHYGARIAAALEAVHAQGSARIYRRQQTAQSGIVECDNFCDRDDHNAAPFSAQQVGRVR